MGSESVLLWSPSGERPAERNNGQCGVSMTYSAEIPKNSVSVNGFRVTAAPVWAVALTLWLERASGA